MKKRILICCNVYPPNFIGGAELIAHYQAKALSQQGHEVVVFTGDAQPQRERHTLHHDTYDGLPIYRVALHPIDYQAEYINFSHPQVERHFNALLDSFSPHIVHFHNIIGLSVGLVQVAKRKRITTVLTVHDHWGFCYKNTLLKDETAVCRDYTQCAECLPFLHDGDGKGIPIRMRNDFVKIQLSQVDAFISPSQYLADAYIRAGFSADRFHVVWYGIEVQRFAGLPKVQDGSRVRFSFIGYLGRHKGIHTLLEALPLLLEDKHQIMLNLVGDGADRPAYEDRVRALGWEGSVRFWGRIDNRRIEQVYRETDVLILPSIWPENQPVSITEAMAAHIPVIASRIGGIPELIEDGRTGYLFEPGNARELAQKMSACMTDRSQLRKFGENAFGAIAGNTLTNQIEKILAVYTEADRTHETPPVAQEPLLVCLGTRMSAECAWALEAFLQTTSRPWRVVKSEWLSDELIQKAQVLWVVDKAVGVEEIVVGLRNRLPLLVPEDNAELKDLCVYGKCGLYSRDPFETVECLKCLTQNEPLRQIMGQNGLMLFAASRVERT